MKDKSGADITVGCKVAEADFSYGDGIVESITVPCVGGAFNVGVKWADPGKGGPAWSKEGGGRGAAHLLVIEAAAEDEDTVGGTFFPPQEFSEYDLKLKRFKERFRSSPTPSQAEMSEHNWDDLEADDDDDEGEKPGGGEGGHVVKDVVKVGGRVRISFQCVSGAKWYGALVGEGEDGNLMLGLDDGDVRVFTEAQVQQELQAGTMAAATEAEGLKGGLIENRWGYPMAHSFVKLKIGSTLTTVGLLVGLTSAMLAGMPIYHAFKVIVDAIPAPKRLRRKSDVSAQDREGVHSFERGDIVEYMHTEDGQEVERAAVYGVIYAEAVRNDNQHRKFLVLYDVEADTFHVGGWPAWRRVPRASLPADTAFDCIRCDCLRCDCIRITAPKESWDTYCVVIDNIHKRAFTYMNSHSETHEICEYGFE